MLLVHIGEDVDLLGVKLLALAHQVGGAAVVELAGVPQSRPGQNAHANESGAGGHGDREANDAAVMNHIDAHRERKTLDYFGGGDGLRGHRFGLDAGADVVRQVPHVFNNQAVHASLDQHLRIPQRMIDDRLHAIAGIAGGSGQGPQMHHANDRLGHAEKLRE